MSSQQGRAPCQTGWPMRVEPRRLAHNVLPLAVWERRDVRSSSRAMRERFEHCTYLVLAVVLAQLLESDAMALEDAPAM